MLILNLDRVERQIPVKTLFALRMDDVLKIDRFAYP